MDVLLDNECGSPSLHEDGLARYLREVGRSRLLSRGEERGLLEKARNGDRKALNDLVTGNLKWVVGVCGEFRDRGLHMTDLIAEGNLGLIRAAQSFEPDQGRRFTPYAIWWIRQGLEKALSEQARYRNTGGADALERMNGRSSLPAGGADPPEPVGEVRRKPASANRISPELRLALGKVAEPGRTVLKLYFGLDTPGPMTLEGIGRVLGVETGRAEHLKNQALKQLQKVLSEARAPDYREARPAFHP